ncbi:MAG: hypothetical protein KDD34_02195 [Bdellovibrionales bacterium]|nr:hypothetical protein [Bdellovibrionales bacterium]
MSHAKEDSVPSQKQSCQLSQVENDHLTPLLPPYIGVDGEYELVQAWVRFDSGAEETIVRAVNTAFGIVTSTLCPTPATLNHKVLRPSVRMEALISRIRLNAQLYPFLINGSLLWNLAIVFVDNEIIVQDPQISTLDFFTEGIDEHALAQVPNLHMQIFEEGLLLNYKNVRLFYKKSQLRGNDGL